MLKAAYILSVAVKLERIRKENTEVPIRISCAVSVEFVFQAAQPQDVASSSTGTVVSRERDRLGQLHLNLCSSHPGDPSPSHILASLIMNFRFGSNDVTSGSQFGEPVPPPHKKKELKTAEYTQGLKVAQDVCLGSREQSNIFHCLPSGMATWGKGPLLRIDA